MLHRSVQFADDKPKQHDGLRDSSAWDAKNSSDDWNAENAIADA